MQQAKTVTQDKFVPTAKAIFPCGSNLLSLSSIFMSLVVVVLLLGKNSVYVSLSTVALTVFQDAKRISHFKGLARPMATTELSNNCHQFPLHCPLACIYPTGAGGVDKSLIDYGSWGLPCQNSGALHLDLTCINTLDPCIFCKSMCKSCKDKI
jgi:hypothetical protein